MQVKLKFPADMSAHWSAIGCGGCAQGEGHICHRCMVKYSEMGRVFTAYLVQEGDTLLSISKSHGIDVKELRTINPSNPVEEEQLKYLDLERECNKKPPKARAGTDKPPAKCPPSCSCQSYTSKRTVDVRTLEDEQPIPSTFQGETEQPWQPEAQTQPAASKKKAPAKKKGSKQSVTEAKPHFIRVHKQYPMNRESPKDAMLHVSNTAMRHYSNLQYVYVNAQRNIQMLVLTCSCRFHL
jgi:hypothetical protein